jgi:NAD(P)H-dependent flavin oxidoreductase YrpB (nitropropane dioxygenase family)
VTTPICERLGIEFPIFAFSHCRDVVAAVSRAGGYGVLGALAYSPDQLDMELTWIDENCGGKPYGVDIVMPAKYVGQGDGAAASLHNLHELIPQEHRDFVEQLLEEHDVPPLPSEAEDDQHIVAAGLNVETDGNAHVEISLAHDASMLVNALGPPPAEVIAQAHDNDVLVGALIGSRQHAERQVAQGVDVIVAQGTEAGGHTGEVATMVLVPEVVDAVGSDAVVLAAGGIGTGRQMAAALALGAQGVWTGSIWLAVAEANTDDVVMEKLLAASSRDTVRSRAWSGKPARQLRTAWTDAWERSDTPDPLPMPLQGIVHMEAFHRVSRAGNKELHGFPVGQIVGRMNRVRSAREVVLDMVDEWIDTTQRLSGLIDGK